MDFNVFLQFSQLFRFPNVTKEGKGSQDKCDSINLDPLYQTDTMEHWQGPALNKAWLNLRGAIVQICQGAFNCTALGLQSKPCYQSHLQWWPQLNHISHTGLEAKKWFQCPNYCLIAPFRCYYAQLWIPPLELDPGAFHRKKKISK